jgi:ketosteroid isomerase-like protein
MAKSSKNMGTAVNAEAAFYDAIARADIAALMALWAEDDEIVCVHPGGSRLAGHAEIRASWEKIFERGGVHISVSRLHETHNMLTAVHSIVEEVHRAEGRTPDLHVIATNVFLKTAQGWRIVIHHASVAPGPPPSHQPAGTVLH